MTKTFLSLAALIGLAVFLMFGAANSAQAQEPVPCKPGEVRLPDGRCLMPACPTGYALDEDGNCVPLGPECQPGRPCYAEPLRTQVPCKPGEVRTPDGRCLFPQPPLNLQCKPVHLQIEPACLKAEGCVPEPGVAASLLFTMLVKCY